jgi:translation initiation factor 5
MFRYTMPVMVLKQESRLNGVKTNVTNLKDVANALRVPDQVIIKYFCAEVGANQEQDSIVKGQHTLENLQKILDK